MMLRGRVVERGEGLKGIELAERHVRRLNVPVRLFLVLVVLSSVLLLFRNSIVVGSRMAKQDPRTTTQETALFTEREAVMESHSGKEQVESRTAELSPQVGHSAAMESAAKKLAFGTSSTWTEILEDVVWVQKSTQEYSPHMNVNTDTVGNVSMLGDDAFRGRIKSKPPRKPRKFAYVFAADGDEQALKAYVGMCMLRRLGSDRLMYMLASNNVDEGILRIATSLGAELIMIDLERPPMAWIPKGSGALKLFLMALGEFYENGLFMESDVMLTETVEDEVNDMIASGVEFAARSHKSEFCITNSIMFHKPSMRRMRRLAMRVMVDNFSWNCSRADQSVLSAEFRPWQTHPAPAKSLTAGPRVQPLDFTNRTLQINHTKELHWQWERDGLLRMYDQRFSKHLTGWTPECKRFFEHTLRSEALRSDEFACENATTSCGERLAAVQGV
mmetsp:Transcript_10463/g.22098  ORF Transcript_10463/g.22098 Transcript_10463/m.22098 type:complete len:445 (-) Transcript_10463:464-1798(-)